MTGTHSRLRDSPNFRSPNTSRITSISASRSYRYEKTGTHPLCSVCAVPSRPVLKGGKDLAPAPEVEVGEVRAAKSSAKSQSDDAAGGRAGDQIEVRRHGSASQVALFQSRQDSGRVYPADAAAINGQDAEVPILRPREWNAAALERPAGSFGWIGSVSDMALSPQALHGARRRSIRPSPASPRSRPASRSSKGGLCRRSNRSGAIRARADRTSTGSAAADRPRWENGAGWSRQALPAGVQAADRHGHPRRPQHDLGSLRARTRGRGTRAPDSSGEKDELGPPK